MVIVWVCVGVFTFLITTIIKNHYYPPINYISETDTDSIQNTEEFA